MSPMCFEMNVRRNIVPISSASLNGVEYIHSLLVHRDVDLGMETFRFKQAITDHWFDLLLVQSQASLPINPNSSHPG